MTNNVPVKWAARKLSPPSRLVTLAEAKAFLRVTESAEDGLIDAIVSSAEEMVEGETGLTLVSAEWMLRLSGWPDRQGSQRIELPFGPILSANAVSSVTYLAESGRVAVDPASYTVLASAVPPVIDLAFGKEWPAAIEAENAVEVRYTAGHGSAAAAPAMLRLCVLVAVAALYSNRGDTPADMPALFHRLCRTQRVGWA